MSFGFPPRYSIQIPLLPNTEQQFLILGGEVFDDLGWERNKLSRHSCSAFIYPMANLREEVTISINDGTVNINSYSCNSRIYDDDRNFKNVGDFIDCLARLRTCIPVEVLDRKFSALQNEWTSTGEPAESGPPPPGRKGIADLFIPRRNFSATAIMIELNLIVAIVMLFYGAGIEPDRQTMLAFGANYRPKTLNGEPWRLLTYMFVHSDLLQLFANIFTLIFIGISLEPRIGTLRFLTSYIFCGVIAGLGSIVWYPATVSSGATGVIFGLFGVSLALLSVKLIEKPDRKAYFVSIAYFLAYIVGMFRVGKVDYILDLVGLLGGLLIGFSWIPTLRREHSQQNRTVTVIATLLSAMIFLFGFFHNGSFLRMPKIEHLTTQQIIAAGTGFDVSWRHGSSDVETYNADMRRFKTMEKEALHFYSLGASTTEADSLSEIKDHGMYYWLTAIDMLNKDKELLLVDSLRSRNKLLIQYCTISSKSFDLLYKKVSEHSSVYDIEISNCNKQIVGLLSRLR